MFMPCTRADQRRPAPVPHRVLLFQRTVPPVRGGCREPLGGFASGQCTCAALCGDKGSAARGTPFGFVSTAAFSPLLVSAQLAVPVPSVDGWVTGPASSILPKLFGEGLAGLPAAKVGADVQAIVWWFVVRVCASRAVKSLFPSCTTRVWVF